MESDLFDLDNAVKGMAALAAIPPVVFALWSDYALRIADQKSRNLEQGRDEENDGEGFDLAAETARLRAIGLMVLIYETLLYFGSDDLRKLAPGWTSLCTMGAVILQLCLQASADHRLKAMARPVPRWPAQLAEQRAKAADQAKRSLALSLRAGLWTFLAGAVSLLFIGLTMLISAWICKASGGGVAAIQVTMACGLFVGIGASFIANIFCAPNHLRAVFPTRPVTDVDLLAGVKDGFERAQLPMPNVRIIEIDQPGSATAIMAGFPKARGLFRPTLFFSRAAVQGLTPAELKAVVLHEVAHLALRHLRRRVWKTMKLVLTTTTFGTGALVLAQLSSGGNAGSFLGPIIATIAFVAAFRLLLADGKLQELEADRHSIEGLKGDPVQLVFALRKLDRLSHAEAGSEPSRTLRLHPETEVRIRAIELRFITAFPDKDKSDGESDQSAA